MVLLLSLGSYKSAPGQTQQQFQNYQNPTSGISIQYPSDWELLQESNDKLRFIKQEGFVTADLNVDEIEQSDTTLRDYTNTRINELRFCILITGGWCAFVEAASSGFSVPGVIVLLTPGAAVITAGKDAGSDRSTWTA